MQHFVAKCYNVHNNTANDDAFGMQVKYILLTSTQFSALFPGTFDSFDFLLASTWTESEEH
jgi:hypothetical protein